MNAGPPSGADLRHHSAVGVNGSGSGSDVAWRLAGSITIEREAGQTVLCLAGEVDGAVVEQFEHASGERLPPVDVVDAGAATFLSSSGVRLLIRVRQESAARSRTVLLRTASPQVERVLRMARVLETFRRPPASA